MNSSGGDPEFQRPGHVPRPPYKYHPVYNCQYNRYQRQCKQINTDRSWNNLIEYQQINNFYTIDS